MTAGKRISIISPCFNEQENIAACHAAVRDLFAGPLAGYDHEHIFADNASTDDSVAEIRRLATTDPHVKAIINARNYGPFRSTFNALSAATGDAVLVMLPVDLQDPPELLPVFVRKWEEGAKIVYGQRTARIEGWLMRKIRRIYYRMVSHLAGIDIPIDTAEFQLLDRQVVAALLRFNDHYPYIRGMIANVGFRDRAVMVPYTWRERKHGMSKNRFFNLVDQGLNGMIAFTNVPMRLAAAMGFMLAIGSIAYSVIQLVINLLVAGAAPPGIATLIVALFFFSGIQLLFIGLLGEYVSSIHFQVRQGPVVVERERINFDGRENEQ